MLARHSELGEFAQTFFEPGFGKGRQCSKSLIYLALREPGSVRKAPEACNGLGDFPQMFQSAFLDGFADHGALRVVPVLEGIYQR